MDVGIDNTAAPRTGLKAFISPWAMHHLRLCAGIRFASALILVTAAAFMASAGLTGWVALPLAFAALHVAWGYWQLTIARSVAPRT
jgi:hypothetical protein